MQRYDLSSHEVRQQLEPETTYVFCQQSAKSLDGIRGCYFGRNRGRLAISGAIVVNQLFRFSSAVKRDPAVGAWMNEHTDELGAIARHWFGVIRDCGDDVRELLHDGHPTACAAGAAFAYVNAFKAHVNVGFFRGAELEDPMGLLEGGGKYMRHVKLRPDGEVDTKALTELIKCSYADMRRRIETA